MPKGSPELTSARKEEIISACRKLYETMSFKDIIILRRRKKSFLPCLHRNMNCLPKIWISTRRSIPPIAGR